VGGCETPPLFVLSSGVIVYQSMAATPLVQLPHGQCCCLADRLCSLPWASFTGSRLPCIRPSVFCALAVGRSRIVNLWHLATKPPHTSHSLPHHSVPTACRVFLFQDLPPIHIPAGTHVEFRCYGKYINLYSKGRRVPIADLPERNASSPMDLLGVGASLSFHDCAVSTFQNKANIATLPLSVKMPLQLFGNSANSQVFATNSSIEAPCPVRPPMHQPCCTPRLPCESSRPHASFNGYCVPPAQKSLQA
jgi:hypothetical protein